MIAFVDPIFSYNFEQCTITIKNVNLMPATQRNDCVDRRNFSIYSENPLLSHQQQYAETPLRCFQIKCKLQIRPNLS